MNRQNGVLQNIKKKKAEGSLSVVLGNVSNILSAATLLMTILEEGIGLMFYRIRLALKEEREIKAQGRQEVFEGRME